ncbi:lysoplasmalogenase [Desulfobacula sp.]|uniref:lysoplasmalogenase n=1 Tax=Desulfobacula sp. TaxID=2593537 RepID=UPI0026060EBC|nr:lysoplasmalogenase [Desulfobacula sp.]
MIVLILCMAVFFLTGLILAEKKESTLGKLITKLPLSILFVLAAMICQRPDPAYYRLILSGLLMSLLGDVLLVFYRRDLFLAGLAAFLMGHIFFALALFNLGRTPSPGWGFLCSVITIAGLGVFVWLRPHLGTMKGPVIAYLLVISCMLAGAGKVLFEPAVPKLGRGIIFAGALLFYFSDVFVARDRLVEKAFVNRLLGLPIYYAAQFLLAFSVGLVG